MFEEFILDLKVARKKSGLTQEDCGHLIGGSNHKISQLERGERPPTIQEICALSLIYGRNFESLFGEMFTEVRKDLAENLETLPDPVAERPGGFNRASTLKALERRLQEESHPRYAG
ncbi:helix-turn-helix transcriptional regulator [Pseudohalocynthiibacter sp. F2068]|uniref:helix-turn-helix transcriptional regulator n=1 Tax=Pseudohalocynthiibacter sp. F2068 TaxID=2926418 RepID=UPI001FF124E4|nr:helix-turn-helix transcriptional regulator [Pseudohalocynthiibacter sp. F2068]MCK0103223.1 helix-turn-helix transcriptional regulator [Pseudohalocynthiibacter sp. F2068]